MSQQSRGFTILEVMVIVSIVGMLFAVAYPAYRNYDRRMAVATIVEAMTACRGTITKAYQASGALPPAGNWGCEKTLAKTPSIIRVESDATGNVDVTIEDLGGDANGRISLRPKIVNGTIAGWVCGGSGTSVPLKFLPGMCRG